MPTSIPLIGVTADNRDSTAESGKYQLNITYTRAIALAGGLPVMLPHEPELAEHYVTLCDGLVIPGGDDARTEAFGEPMHPMAKPIDARRQAFELALLAALDRQPDKPVLAVCLGCQLMALHAGGKLHQHLPEIVQRAESHQKDNRHDLKVLAEHPYLKVDSKQADASWTHTSLTVPSSHHQAVANPGRLRVIAKAADGVIEALDDPRKRFYLGVQWHPERGGDDELNLGLFRRLVQACRRRT